MSSTEAAEKLRDQSENLPVRRSVWQTTFTSLAEREFSWFWACGIAFTMAMQMQIILFGFLAYDLTDSSKALGLVSTAGAVPTLFVGALGGALADRLDKRMLIFFAQAGTSLTLTVITFLTVSGSLELWHLLATSVALSGLVSLNMPARQALMPQLVPRQKLMNAISLQMGGMNLTAIIAPALAGLMVAPLGPGAVLGVSAALFCASTLGTLKLPSYGMVIERERRSIAADLGEGFAYIWHNQMLRLLILVSMIMPMLVFPARQMLPVFASDVFDSGASGLGLLAAASGVGGLIGAILSANLNDQPRKGRLMFIGGLMMAAFTFLFALMPNIGLAALCLALSSIGQMLLLTTTNSAIQAILPSVMRGRVSAVTLMSFGITPLAVFPVTVAADAFGAPGTIAVAALVMVSVLVLLFAASPQLRSLRQDALESTALSEVQAAGMVARGEISREEASELSRPA